MTFLVLQLGLTNVSEHISLDIWGNMGLYDMVDENMECNLNKIVFDLPISKCHAQVYSTPILWLKTPLEW